MSFKNIFVAMMFSHLANVGVAIAKIEVMTTTQNLKALVEEIGGSNVKAASYCGASQDPHHLEAKPSFISKTRSAQLVVAIGLDLEVAWLYKVLKSGRNPAVMKGSRGYLEVGPGLSVLERPNHSVSRADGDVHPEGNPHVDLDPIRLGDIAQKIGRKLAEIDPSHKGAYLKNAEAFKRRMELKTAEWQKRIQKTGIKKVITFHKSLSYFLDRFQLTAVATLEPLPGVPPTGPHILSVIKKAGAEGVKLTLVEHLFDDSVAQKVGKDVKGMRVVKVPIFVKSFKGIDSIDDLFEFLVRSIEGA